MMVAAALTRWLGGEHDTKLRASDQSDAKSKLCHNSPIPTPPRAPLLLENHTVLDRSVRSVLRMNTLRAASLLRRPTKR